MHLPPNLAQLLTTHQPKLFALELDDFFQLQAILVAPPILPSNMRRQLEERARGLTTYIDLRRADSEQLAYLKRLATYNQAAPNPTWAAARRPAPALPTTGDVLDLLQNTAPDLFILTSEQAAQLTAYLAVPPRRACTLAEMYEEKRTGGNRCQQAITQQEELHNYLKRVAEYNRLWEVHCQVNAHDENQHSTSSETLKSPQAWDSWTQVGIGIHEDRSIYAFIPVPPLGGKVTLKAGIPLKLTGTRWQCIFELAMQSPNGRAISKIRLLQLLRGISERTVPPRTYDNDEAAAEGLSLTGIKSPSRYLSNTLAELRKQLTKAVQPKQPIRDLPLKVVGDEVDLGITIRPLLKDDRGGIRFG